VTWFVHGLTTADRWFRGSIAIHTAIVEASM
jgi:hypothetical protein